MSEDKVGPGMHRVIGPILTVFAIGLIFLAWTYGLDGLVGTIFEELRYIIFAAFVFGLLSGLQNVLSRLLL